MESPNGRPEVCGSKLLAGICRLAGGGELLMRTEADLARERQAWRIVKAMAIQKEIRVRRVMNSG